MAYSSIRTLLLMAVMAWAFSSDAQLEGKISQTMLDQIAELNAYSAVAADGYRLVENGWHGVAVIRQGEWDLHKTYYEMLLTVNPAVRGMAEAGDIVRVAGRLANAGRGKEAEAAVSDLTALLTDGQLSMTDGERMRRIIALDAELRMKEKLK
jgi:hypothetical protein